MLIHTCLRRASLACATLALGACASLPNRPTPLVNYQPESFGANAYAKHYGTHAPRTCEAARRALLSQGYIVSAASADQVVARKYFQPFADHHVQLEFRVVCATDGDGSGGSTVFVNGLKDQYVVRKAKESASLGVGGIGSLSLPLEGSLDSMVKVGSETVTDRELYERFFQLLGDHLARAADVPAVPAEVASAPASSPGPAAGKAQAAVAPPTFVILQPGTWAMSSGGGTGVAPIAAQALPLATSVLLPADAASAPQAAASAAPAAAPQAAASSPQDALAAPAPHAAASAPHAVASVPRPGASAPQ